MKLNKKYLKSLFEAQIDLENRIVKIEQVTEHAVLCEKCQTTSQDFDKSIVQGLRVGEKLIDALINDYLNLQD